MNISQKQKLQLMNYLHKYDKRMRSDIFIFQFQYSSYQIALHIHIILMKHLNM